MSPRANAADLSFSGFMRPWISATLVGQRSCNARGIGCGFQFGCLRLPDQRATQWLAPAVQAWMRLTTSARRVAGSAVSTGLRPGGSS
jgi:hypothetical protein